MQKQKNGFTLVELIVVITILAILGTIAFISLQGYSQDAKNSKVSSDIRTLVSAIETSSTEGNGFSMIDLVKDAGTHGNAVVSGTFSSGVLLTSATYNVGKINFPFIRQGESDFKDSEGNEYVAGLISESANPDNIFYQIAGQTKNKGGNYDAVVKGSYLKIGPGDVDGLIAGVGYVNGVTNESMRMADPGIY